MTTNGNFTEGNLMSLAAGSSAIGSVTQSAATSGGYTPFNLISATSTNATSLKASPGQIGYINIGNVNAAARYLKLYNKASAPTVGTDVPVATLIIPGGVVGTSNNLIAPTGIEFTLGIAFALTTGITVADTGVVAANEITVNIGYK